LYIHHLSDVSGKTHSIIAEHHHHGRMVPIGPNHQAIEFKNDTRPNRSILKKDGFKHVVYDCNFWCKSNFSKLEN